MEKLKKQHDHTATEKLKVIIFSIIMLAPLLAVMSECLIAIFNENSNAPLTQFYTAVDHLGQQPLFNWTTNTAIYTGLNAMTSGLEFGAYANTLAVLLTYWALNTAVYIVFDIIIYLFTKITHFTIA